jgi:head-tail adaptor
MSAGRLRESIRFQARPAGSDGYGNPSTEDWANLSPDLVTRARISPMGGNEAVRAMRVTAVATFEIKVRAFAATLAITPEVHRIVNTRSGKTYNIHAIVNADEKNKYLYMTCSTGGADG